MRHRLSQPIFLAFGIAPLILALAQEPAQKEPTAETVYKNIHAFKGLPASELIPAMEFMAGSMGYECADCHNPADFSEETGAIVTTRRMIDLQRDINDKWFNGRLEVTCNSCHGGESHPAATPFPTGIVMQHIRFEGSPRPPELFAKHVAAAGKPTSALVRTGKMTAPNDATHEMETKPVEFIQAPGGKFKLVSGDRTIVSDGTKAWYGPAPLDGEPANIFMRLGRSWRGDEAFAGLDRPIIAGKNTVQGAEAIVVRSPRSKTTSSEDLYFDTKTGLLARVVNSRKSTLGTVVSALDYSNYQAVDGSQTPMKVVMSFAGGQQWVLEFDAAKLDPSVKDSSFTGGTQK